MPRLWASRKIAFLTDEIRQAGATAAGANPLESPRYAELADEILRLSTRFGILSEYPAFLATAGTDLSDWGGLQLACNDLLNGRAVQVRSGVAGINQGMNLNERKQQQWVDLRNGYWNRHNDRVEIATVQQVNDRAFFQRGERWIDARLVGGEVEPDEVVDLGSEAHGAILDRLVAEGRQGALSLAGEVLMPLDGRNVLIRNGVPEETGAEVAAGVETP